MQRATHFKLIIEDDEGRRSIVPVEIGEVSIGRHEGNTIRLKERNVSRRHARLLEDEGGIFAEDLGSHNGVWLNGQRITRRSRLHGGDSLRIGDFRLELRGEGLSERDEADAGEPGAPSGAATQPNIRFEDNETTTTAVQPAPTRRAPPPAAAPQPPVARPPRPPPPPPAGKPPPAAQEPATAPDTDEVTAVVRADAIGLGAQAASGAVAGVQGEERARLICVSTRLAGREFELSKSEMMIGRTADNDIVMPHRSVSRHHARIVAIGNRFKIIDLGSANGTLVNDEEYAQTELRRGDLIELGHVRLRFVPPGAPYKLSRDEAELVRRGRSGRQRAAWQQGTAAWMARFGDAWPAVAMVAVGVTAGIVVALAAVVWRSCGVDDGVGSVRTPPPQPPPQAASPRGAGTDAALPPSQRVQREVERLFSQASVALAQRHWQRAATLGSAVLAMQPDHAAASALVAEAELEAAAQRHYDTAVLAVSDGRWSDAWNDLLEVPAKSTYRTQAASLAQQVKVTLIKERIDGTRAAIQAGKWDRAEGLVEEIAVLDPARVEITQLHDAIAAGRAAAPVTSGQGEPSPTDDGGAAAGSPERAGGAHPGSRPKQKPKQKPPTGRARASADDDDGAADEPEAGPDLGSPRELYQEGVRFVQDGRLEAAVDKFNRCILSDKEFAPCYRALGIVHARLQDYPKAARYYRLYLTLSPNAADAEQVREQLRQYESSQQQ